MSYAKGTSSTHTKASLIMMAGEKIFCLHPEDFKEEYDYDGVLVNPFNELLKLFGATEEQKQANSVVLRIIQVRFVK